MQEPFSFPKSISAHIWWLGTRWHISGSVITQVCLNTQKLKVCLHSNDHSSKHSTRHAKLDKDFHGTWTRHKNNSTSRYEILDAGSRPRAALICHGCGPESGQASVPLVSLNIIFCYRALRELSISLGFLRQKFGWPIVMYSMPIVGFQMLCTK